jgi:hypothetical protein
VTQGATSGSGFAASGFVDQTLSCGRFLPRDRARLFALKTMVGSEELVDLGEDFARKIVQYLEIGEEL